MSPHHLAIRADAVRLCLPYVSSEETRYYLNGVCLEPCQAGDGLLAVATDGHKMGVARDELGAYAEGSDRSPIIVRLSRIKSALTPKRDDGSLFDEHKYLAPRWLVIHDQLAMIVIAESAQDALEVEPISPLTMAFACNALIDGTFPDWRRVLPRKKDNDEYPAFSAKYLKQIADGYAKVSGDKTPIMRLTSHGAGSAAVINFAGSPELPQFFGALMPVRYDGTSEVLPSWIERLAPKTQEKAA